MNIDQELFEKYVRELRTRASAMREAADRLDKIAEQMHKELSDG